MQYEKEEANGERQKRVTTIQNLVGKIVLMPAALYVFQYTFPTPHSSTILDLHSAPFFWLHVFCFMRLSEYAGGGLL